MVVRRAAAVNEQPAMRLVGGPVSGLERIANGPLTII
jgi:hypothetical protein